jgi:DNA end-binding protein Ku
MARPVWSGALSFGLVSLPVRLFTATDSHTIRFRQLQRGTSDRVRNKRVNERTGKEVPLEEIVKGYEIGDEYVLVEPKELDDIAPGRSQALEITGFVDLEEVDPVFFDRTYYLGPRGAEHAKVYALLAQALERSGQAGIATFVMRNHEYLVAVKAEAGVLTLHTLHWADEIRDPRREISDLPDDTKVTEREMTMARRLIDTLSMEWRPEDYHDTYQEKVARLVEAKHTGAPREKAEPPPESTNVVDLMDALRASVERAESGKAKRGKRAGGARGGSRRTGGTSRRTGGRSGSGRTADRRALESLSKSELYERASAAGVPGRSSMNRGELIDALSSGDGRRREAS